MAILTAVTLASKSNGLPDDGVTALKHVGASVNFNVNFRIVFKTIHLCISWWGGNFDNIKMHSLYVKKKNVVFYS